MVDIKFCVFCGKPPQSKNKEHILPQWLLKLTGDPNRVVSMGYNHKRKTDISFSWKSLVTPACEECNTEYSCLEGEVRPIVEALLERAPLTVDNYSTLLDWLDKVRVGLWLNYHLLMGNPTGIKPSFYINSRLRKKDRFVAIYPTQEKNIGLNAHGVETLSFHGAPSAFGLRINNIFLINCSSDYIFSGRCGFPYPVSMQLHLDGESSGHLQVDNFKSTGKIKSPIFNFKLHKPSVLLFQPIMQSVISEIDQSITFLGGNPAVDPYLLASTKQGMQPGVGKIYRQFKDHVSRLDDENAKVEFDTITGSECRPAGQLVSQVYELQTFLQGAYTPLTESLEVRKHWNQRQKLMKQLNRSITKSYINASSPKN
ncbi:HNH endonuclease [Pseudomonas sp. SG-MS2]|uniref:HNH endonuclease n=1 Tax=Pseudomonas sp. SG-MS2 TaxID=1914534 RepID=UPI0013795149|nr:HNH endonuclease [Pseudomonas sp. SG-MS2]